MYIVCIVNDRLWHQLTLKLTDFVKDPCFKTGDGLIQVTKHHGNNAMSSSTEHHGNYAMSSSTEHHGNYAMSSSYLFTV